jgi:dihydropteroate synthase
MGVLNVTPDSFSDGGQFTTVARAVERGLEMVAAGADILDIGGESSRPGAETVSLAEELERVVPVICALRQRTQVPISVDTTKAEVLREAIAAGADILNDISAGQLDPDILPAAAQLDVPVILMHMQGTPRTMQTDPVYGNVVDEVYTHLDQRIDAAVKAGVKRERIAVDPGIGFGKTLDHNLELIRRCQEFRSLGCPILMGVSRKSFLGKILDRPEPQQRIWGTAAACSMAIAQGADILRVHDVAEMVDVCRVVDGIVRGDCERN